MRRRKWGENGPKSATAALCRISVDYGEWPSLRLEKRHDLDRNGIKMLMRQTLTKNFTAAALDMLAAGETENPEGAMIGGALRGSRLLELFSRVPWKIRDRAEFDERRARAVLKTPSGRALFNELHRESLAKVLFFAKGHRVITLMASAVALWHEQKATNAGAAR